MLVADGLGSVFLAPDGLGLLQEALEMVLVGVSKCVTPTLGHSVDCSNEIIVSFPTKQPEILYAYRELAQFVPRIERDALDATERSQHSLDGHTTGVHGEGEPPTILEEARLLHPLHRSRTIRVLSEG